jgi:hypothetical protein
MAHDEDDQAREELRRFLVRVRDDAADALNRLDDGPPASQAEYLDEKTQLMARWRVTAILADQVEAGSAHD